ncbi:MAG: GNAT family N-acetyltransferase [Ignavibacteria bacterium]|nr:GNAT family N-acetyltransferase [Ignavibacteria bacterium]
MTDNIYKIKTAEEEISIRRFTPADPISEITNLLHTSYKFLANLGLRYLATHQDDSETEKRLKKGIAYVGLSNDKIISTVTLYYDDIDSNNTGWYKRKGVAHFGQFGVLPGYQKKGIGNFMMDIVERKARELGAAEIALDTAEGAVHLIEYYKKRGYRFIEYVNWEVTNYRSVILSKRLCE